jgi:signal transduction histidine kinase
MTVPLPVSRRRLAWLRSLQTRITLAAALAAAVLFTLGTWWVRSVVFDQRMSEAAREARQQSDLMIASTTPSSWPVGDQWGLPYELVAARTLLSSSSVLRSFESRPHRGVSPAGSASGYAVLPARGHALMPLPGHGPSGPDFQTFRVHFPTVVASRGDPLAGLTVTAIDETVPVGELTVVPGSGTGLLARLGADAQVRVYVFITPFAAQQAVSAMDHVLYPGVPLAVLMVAAVAYGATRRALRPVEAIRARTASVNAADPRERVDVPDTGDVIARLATTINDTLQRVDDAAQAKRRVVADAAHELRSPLATLLAILEVAEAYPARADWPGTVAAAADQARRMQALAEDLLLLARLDGVRPARPAIVDLTELAGAVALGYQGRTGAVSVVCDPAGPAPVRAERGQLERLLRNLLDNAVRYAVIQVCVRVYETGHQAVLEVSDDGPGIPAADRERVFERFARLEAARSRQTGGSGLGLAIVREIAHGHQGTVQVADAVPGARLIVRLPRAR